MQTDSKQEKNVMSSVENRNILMPVIKRLILDHVLEIIPDGFLIKNRRHVLRSSMAGVRGHKIISSQNQLARSNAYNLEKVENWIPVHNLLWKVGVITIQRGSSMMF